MFGHQRDKAVGLAPIEPDDCRQVLLLFRCEVVDLARHLPVDVASVDRQYLVAPFFGLVLVEKPELARHRARVEETGADRHHYVHVTRFDQLLSDLCLFAARGRSLRGHDEPGPALFVQVAVEIRNPEVVAVRDLALLVHAGEGIGQARVVLHLLRIDFINVEGWIGHHEIALAGELVRVFVVGDGFLDVAFETVHGEVHIGESDRRRVLLHAIEGDTLGRVLVHVLDEMRTLHEHTAGAAGRVEHLATVGFDDVDDRLDERDRREELPAVVGLLIGELRQEILVDAPEDVSIGALESRIVEGAQDLPENVVVEFLVLRLGQGAAQGLVVLFDPFHGVDDRPGPVRAVRQGDETVELCFRTEEDRPFLGEVFFGEPAGLPPSLRQRRFNLAPDLEETTVRVPKEDQPHHGKEVLVAGKVGIGPQVVRAGPKPFLDFPDVFQWSISLGSCARIHFPTSISTGDADRHSGLPACSYDVVRMGIAITRLLDP